MIEGGGVERDSEGPVAWDAEAFEFSCAANSSNEINSGIGTDIFDAEDWVEDLSFEDGDIEGVDGIAGVGWIRGDFESPPAVVDKEAEGSGCLGHGIFCLFKISEGIEFFEEFADGEPIQIPDDSVVGEDSELIGGEQDGEEPVAFGGGLKSLGQLLSQFCPGAPCAGSAVVTIGDIEDGNG
ncbi:MAG: hypothetical protein RL215_475 [Planctomycetota bacterium]